MLRFTKFLLPTTLVALALAACSTGGRNPAEEAAAHRPVFYRGLESIDLDRWTLGFYATQAPDNPIEGKVKQIVLAAFEESADAGAVFDKLRKAGLNRPYANYEGYRVLADGLLAARKILRKRETTAAIKQTSALLQVLLEETLYVAGLRHPEQFPDSKPYFRAVFGYPEPTACQKDGKLRLGTLVDNPICSGDVMLMKGSAGSSSFLARFSDSPANFSHSFVAHVAAGTKKVTLMESLIEDGAKLRDPAGEYGVNKAVRKMSYYRYNGDNRRATLGKIVAATDQAYVNFQTRAGGDAFSKPAFPYDFLMDADGPTKDDALFCSEIPLYVYSSLGGLQDDASPYPKARWSTISGGTRTFFERFLKIPQLTLPAPSDLEQNPAFDLTAVIIAPRLLGDDRIDVAFIDVLVTRLNENAPRLVSFFQRIETFGEHTVTEKDLAWLRSQPWVPAAHHAKLKDIPAGISVKQLGFFVALNEVMIPNVRRAARAYEKKVWESDKRPAGLLELRAVVEQAALVELANLEKQIKDAGL